MSRNTYTLFHYVHSFYLLCFFSCHSNILFFFFFQAEDGIRDHCVTGVQTCALPISPTGAPSSLNATAPASASSIIGARSFPLRPFVTAATGKTSTIPFCTVRALSRMYFTIDDSSTGGSV